MAIMDNITPTPHFGAFSRGPMTGSALSIAASLAREPDLGDSRGFTDPRDLELARLHGLATSAQERACDLCEKYELLKDPESTEARELDDAYRSALDDASVWDEAFREAPYGTPAGLLFKLQVFHKDDWMGEERYHETILSDVKRLVREMAR